MRLQRVLLAFVLSVLAGTASAFGPLMEVGDLPGDATVVDIRSTDDFAAGHVLGAVNVPYAAWRGPRENPGRVPAAEDLQRTLQAAGIDRTDRVVVVHAGANATDFGAAARVYWTLKSTGLTELAILNGGYAAWTATGAVPSTEAAPVEPSGIEVSFDTTWWMDADGVKDVIAGRSEAVLIDARPDAFFKGEQKHGAAAEAGTLEGAVNLVNFAWFGGVDNPVIDANPDLVARVRALSEEAGGAPLVSFCNTGHWAATNWFAASELAGIEGVKLYPESMVGWTLLGNPATVGIN